MVIGNVDLLDELFIWLFDVFGLIQKFHISAEQLCQLISRMQQKFKVQIFAVDGLI